MSAFDSHTPAPDAPAAERARIERLARKRAGAKMGWYVHALVFVCVNAGLALISVGSGRPGSSFRWPAGAWAWRFTAWWSGWSAAAPACTSVCCKRNA